MIHKSSKDVSLSWLDNLASHILKIFQGLYSFSFEHSVLHSKLKLVWSVVLFSFFNWACNLLPKGEFLKQTIRLCSVDRILLDL